MHPDPTSSHHKPWRSSDHPAASEHEHYLFSTKSMIGMALLLGTAIGFGICTAQSHAGSSQPDEPAAATSQAPATFTGPVTYVPAPAPPAMSQPAPIQAVPAGVPMLAAPAEQMAAPAGQPDMSTASGDFVNSQGILYTRTVLPAPEYPMNPNWTTSRNGLIGNPPVDPPSCQGRAYSMPLN
jgi:hypothetical protein